MSFETGRLEVFCGGMFADKSTNLIRQAKRHMMAGRSVIMIKPEIDNRYSKNEVVTHDGQKLEAIVIKTSTHMQPVIYRKIVAADVVLIDEVQFFDENAIRMVQILTNQLGKTVYVAGLDMDKNGKPFETTAELMALAEEVHKVKAVCRDCGEDAWLTVETVEQAGRVNIGNDYKPVCRKCAASHLGGYAIGDR